MLNVTVTPLLTMSMRWPNTVVEIEVDEADGNVTEMGAEVWPPHVPLKLTVPATCVPLCASEKVPLTQQHPLPHAEVT